MEDTRYCLCCGEQVPFSTFERHGKREVTCAYCGFTLDVQKLAKTESTSRAGYALVTDDSRYTRKIIEDLIREKEVFSTVLSFENGLELISSYSELVTEKKPVLVSIIDLNMPVMDGLTAARTMRALEAKNGARKVPIIFFSGLKADRGLREQMDSLAPANYVNKGPDPDPDQLAARLEGLLAFLVKKYSRPSE
ncbi:MAG: response regulator [Candidatus Sulfobium sp.]|jgi:CheY-like chemotaxis protein